MGVYGLVWTPGTHWTHCGTFSVLFRYFFRYLTVLDAFLSLTPLQYGCLWTPLDPNRSLVPVPRYFFGTFSVLFGTFSVLFGRTGLGCAALPDSPLLAIIVVQSFENNGNKSRIAAEHGGD